MLRMVCRFQVNSHQKALWWGAGDGEELAAIDAVYGSGDGLRAPDNALLIGSVKSNMGHCEGASGLAGERLLILSF